MTHSGPREMGYSRVLPGDHAGTVVVRCEPDGDATLAHVAYRLTALGPDGGRGPAEFEEAYAGFMTLWEELIGAAVSGG